MCKCNQYKADFMEGDGCGAPTCPFKKKQVPHKHAAVIKAWADGATIQVRGMDGASWMTMNRYPQPMWLENVQYRVKPEPKPLWQVLREAILHRPACIGPETSEEYYTRCVNNVIKAYKDIFVT